MADTTAIDNIPDRSNGDDVTASWWNIIKTQLQAWALQVTGWEKLTFSYTAFSTAGTTQTIELKSLATRAMISGIIVKHSANFTGGAISAYTVKVGITGTLDKYTTPFDVFQAVADAARQATNPAEEPESFAAATSIKITAESTGANLDQATQGSVDVWVKTSTLPV